MLRDIRRQVRFVQLVPRGMTCISLLLLTGCERAVLYPRGPIAAAERSILLDSLAIMLAIVVPTIAATLAFAWWFRASNTRAQRLPDWAFSGKIELVTWSVPLLTIMLLGGVTWISSHQLDPAQPITSKEPALDVQVVSLDWKWLFIYPEQHVASVNRLVVPTGRPVHFALTSASVMNSFFVPQLGGMIYTMNGMATQLNLVADQEGSYRGLSGHYSGDGFSDMHFEVAAMPQDRFDAWLTQVKSAGSTLDAAAYAALARQSTVIEPVTYSRTDDGLFDKVVAQALPPGPGPTEGPEAAVHPKMGH